MINIFRRKTLMNRVEAICRHMNMLYNFHLHSNRLLNRQNILKRLVEDLTDWELVGGNILKHRNSFRLINIHENENLLELTKHICMTEVEEIFGVQSSARLNKIKREISEFIDRYYKLNVK